MVYDQHSLAKKGLPVTVRERCIDIFPCLVQQANECLAIGGYLAQ